MGEFGSLHPRIAALIAAGRRNVRLVVHSELIVPVRTPRDVALALGYDEARITKALLLKAEDIGRFCLAVLPVFYRANLRIVAARLGALHCRMATSDELERILGQPSGGVTPLANEGLPVLLDDSLRRYDTVLVGGGSRGTEVELPPDDLCVLTGGEWVPFSRPPVITGQSELNPESRSGDGGSATVRAT